MSIDRAVQGTESCAQEGRYLRGEPDVKGLQAGSQDAGMDFGEKERDAAPGGGEHVAVLVVKTLEQAFAPQASQVVAHLADAVGRAQEGGYQLIWQRL